MKLSKLLQATLLGAAALGMGIGGAFAVCDAPPQGFPNFQCADLAYVAPAPFTVTFDVATGRPTNVLTRIWQLGFGNDLLNTGTGITGTGNIGPVTFNGNDAGQAAMEMAAASSISTLMPSNAICLRSFNWANAGVDGCPDNVRTTAGLVFADDDVLNPYYNVYYTRAFAYQGVYSNYYQQDYPIAMLSQDTITGRWFALSAVASVNRGNTGGPGTCNGGTNPAPCDVRAGSYEFKDIVNGGPNQATIGVNNVVQWQEVPRPHAACTAGCSGAGTRTIDFTWDVIHWNDDNTLRPSGNPAMFPADSTRAGGVGTRDLRRKTTTTNWMGLVHYTLQQANFTGVEVDPNGNPDPAQMTFSDVVVDIPQPTSPITGAPTAATISALGVSAPVDTCWRILAKFGKLPEFPGTGIGQTTIAHCRIGQCGDRGYEVASVDPASVTCVGGALVSERAEEVRAVKAQGSINVSWVTTAELSMTGFDIIGVGKNGQEHKLGSLNCNHCTDGIGDSYSFDAGKGSLKGGITAVRVEVKGGNPMSVQVPLE